MRIKAFALVLSVAGCTTSGDCTESQIEETRQNPELFAGVGTRTCQENGMGDFAGEFRCAGSTEDGTRRLQAPNAMPRPSPGSLPARAGSPLAGRVSHPLDDERSFMESSHPPFPFDQQSLVALNVLPLDTPFARWR